MTGKSDAARDWEADKRDFVADQRDSAADLRDEAADARDTMADARDDIADAREQQLQAWEQQLRARARHLGLVPPDDGVDTGFEQAAAARDDAAADRAGRGVERERARQARDVARERRSAQRRDTLVAAAFAGIAEYLQESETAEQLLARIAEAAVTTIAGATSATVTIGEGATAGDAVPHHASRPGRREPSLTFAFPTTGRAGESPVAALNVFASDPAALDEAAQDLGGILAAHAALAARTVGERIRLEDLSGQLERALMSRDVIGQAKGILMERLKTTPEDAFELLRRSSQLLNIKLREVARTLSETGQLPPRPAS